MKDSKIRLIALDLDGTTLNEREEISERTIAAFHAAMEKGIHIVICTGRAFQSLPKQLFSVKGLEYVVTSNGAKITELTSMEAIYENTISAEAVRKLVDILRPAGYSVEVFVNGRAYIAKDEYDTYLTIGSSFRDVAYVLRTRTPVEDFFDFIMGHSHEIENINISFPDLEERETIMKLLSQVKDITLTSSFIHNIEIGGATTSKAEALRYLMDCFQLKPSQLLAAGDSLNDLEMIKLAGLGIVMENGSEEMKSYADFVADHHNRDGVAKVIEKFALSE